MKQLPIDGDVRYVLVYPLVPVICNSQERIWLEWVVVEQRYTYGNTNPIKGWVRGWENIRVALDKNKSATTKRVGVVSLVKGIFERKCLKS